jgi:EamA domain-containing membrane protein RarD
MCGRRGGAVKGGCELTAMIECSTGFYGVISFYQQFERRKALFDIFKAAVVVSASLVRVVLHVSEQVQALLVFCSR